MHPLPRRTPIDHWFIRYKRIEGVPQTLSPLLPLCLVECFGTVICLQFALGEHE
jgi:hypothetical protein